MAKSCQELICVAVEESGSEGFLEEVGQKEEGIEGSKVPGFRGRNVLSVSKAGCSLVQHSDS